MLLAVTQASVSSISREELKKKKNHVKSGILLRPKCIDFNAEIYLLNKLKNSEIFFAKYTTDFSNFHECFRVILGWGDRRNK